MAQVTISTKQNMMQNYLAAMTLSGLQVPGKRRILSMVEVITHSLA